MSSTQSPPVVSSSSSLPQPPPHNNAASNASNLLFGFLVSALSIFAVFMAFAVVWNRLIARRRAIEAMLAASSGPGSPRSRRPVMQNIWIIPDRRSFPLGDIKPVAALACNHPLRSSRTTQTEQSIPFWRRLLDRLPPEITYLFYQPTAPEPLASNDTHTPQIDLSHGSDIQVALLIAMPHAPATRGAHEKEPMFREMVFATANIPYHEHTT